MARALTLIEPWAWAIAHRGKRYEHRSWAPWQSIIGQRVAIHAGKSFDEGAAQMIERETGIVVPRNTPRGIVAVARVDGFVDDKGGTDRVKVYSTNHDCLERCKAAHEVADQRWYGGGLAWVLDDVWTLPEPVPCRGAQGLWVIPAGELVAVNAQLVSASREPLR